MEDVEPSSGSGVGARGRRCGGGWDHDYEEHVDEGGVSWVGGCDPNYLAEVNEDGFLVVA